MIFIENMTWNGVSDLNDILSHLVTVMFKGIAGSAVCGQCTVGVRTFRRDFFRRARFFDRKIFRRKTFRREYYSTDLTDDSTRFLGPFDGTIEDACLMALHATRT